MQATVRNPIKMIILQLAITVFVLNSVFSSKDKPMRTARATSKNTLTLAYFFILPPNVLPSKSFSLSCLSSSSDSSAKGSLKTILISSAEASSASFFSSLAVSSESAFTSSFGFSSESAFASSLDSSLESAFATPLLPLGSVLDAPSNATK